MVLRFAVAEIEPNYIDTGFDHGLQHGGIAGSWAQGGNNFGGVVWHVKSKKIESYCHMVNSRICPFFGSFAMNTFKWRA
jgi:hypothetical protein